MTRILFSLAPLPVIGGDVDLNDPGTEPATNQLELPSGLLMAF